MRRTTSPARVALAVAGALTLSGCSGASGTPAGGSSATIPAARPSSPATVRILTPSNGQVITGATVPLKVRLQGARIVPATTTHITPTTGHLHVFLDGRIVSMTFGVEQEIPNVRPGTHVLRVEFVASDHRPFDPRVFAQVVFEAKP